MSVLRNAVGTCDPTRERSSTHVKSPFARTARLVGVRYWRSNCLQCPLIGKFAVKFVKRTGATLSLMRIEQPRELCADSPFCAAFQG
jgi:hypothetical protein